MSICKKCGTEIVPYVDSDGRYWHPFFAGYCPECDGAVTFSQVKEDEKK